MIKLTLEDEIAEVVDPLIEATEGQGIFRSIQEIDIIRALWSLKRRNEFPNLVSRTKEYLGKHFFEPFKKKGSVEYSIPVFIDDDDGRDYKSS